MNDIRNYGAIGDGKALDTAAIQAAVDAGGMVFIPKGIYRTGTIYLKSNGGLYLDHGATLVASHDFEDYNKSDFCPQNWTSTAEFQQGEHLIVAVEQENVTIEGHGTIDGQGRFWMNDSCTTPGWPFPENRDFAPKRHPSQMLYFCECKNVHVSDVTLTNSPYWHLFFHGCEDVSVRGLVIKGDRSRWTNDGIDIDCCSCVTVTNCSIDVGDDAIALRADGKRLLHREAVNEKITISNCVLRASRDYGMRIGVGAGTIRDCVISNMIIEAPNCAGIGFMGRWHPKAQSATSIERVLFSNIRVSGLYGLEMTAAVGDDPLPNPCFMRNIAFSNMILEQERCSQLCGNDEVELEDVRFSDLTVIPRLDDYPTGHFHLSNASRINFDRLTICGENRCRAVTFDGGCDIAIDGEVL